MAQKKSFDDEFNRLTELCSSTQAKKKIADIVCGILNKNQNVSARLRRLDEQIKFVDSQIQKIPQPKIVSKPVPKPDSNNLQKNNSSSILASLIDKLSSESKDAAAIGQSANITSKGFETDTDWNLISDFKKQEIARKKKRARY